MPWVVVFARDFAPGEHWNPKAHADDSDRRQHWRAGDVYSTTPADEFDVSTLPEHLTALQVPRLALPGELWDRAAKAYRDPNPSEREEQMLDSMVAAANHYAAMTEAELVLLKANLRTHALSSIRVARNRR